MDDFGFRLVADLKVGLPIFFSFIFCCDLSASLSGKSTRPDKHSLPFS